MILPDEEGGSDEGQAGFADEIEKAWDEAESPQDAHDKDLSESVNKTLEDSDEPARDELGRFKSKDGADDDKGDRDGEGGADQERSESLATEPAVSAPEHWSQEDKDKFNSLPDEQKPLWLDTRKSLESGYNKKFEEVATERKTYEPLKEINQVLEPYRQQIAMAGMTPGAYVGRLLAVGQQLMTNPEQTIRQLAQMHNVDLGNPAGAEPDEYTELGGFNPNAYKQEIAQLVQQTLQQNQYQSVQQASEHDWTAFVSAKDAHGNATYPGAENLRILVGAELMRNPQQPGEANRDAIARAYEAVKWTDPDTRKSIMEAEAKAKEAERQRKADLDKAKKSGGPAVKSKTMPGSDTQAPANSWKDELERSWDQAGA